MRGLGRRHNSELGRSPYDMAGGRRIMDGASELLIDILAEFSGGPGSPQNNLVRFGMAALFWAALLTVAASRQRTGDHPRERWLVWGFGLALLREAFMFGNVVLKMQRAALGESMGAVVEPVEHALSLMSTLVIAGAFIRYILDDRRLARRYLAAGVFGTALAILGMLLLPPLDARFAGEGARFHETLPALLVHAAAALFVGSGMLILARRRGWLRTSILLALSLMFLSEMLNVINILTAHAFAYIYCPISNALHIAAIPVFGYVYYHEMVVEKGRADRALQRHREQLEDLVGDRTVELRRANAQLHAEIAERRKIEQRLEHAAALEERQRIAASMHDGLAQTLSYLAMLADQAAGRLEAGATATGLRELGVVQDTIDRAIHEARASISSLRARPRRRRSLQEELGTLVAELRDGDLDIRFDPASTARVVLADRESEQVLRIVQEAVVNARKHARASRVRIILDRRGQNYSLRVRDDGVGFDPENPRLDAEPHFGLEIMQARAAQIGGRLVIRARPGAGCEVRLTWPVAPSSATGSPPAHNGRAEASPTRHSPVGA
jgi:signal transduction histidine kinase